MSTDPTMPNIVFVLLRRMQAPLVVLILAYSTAVLGFVLIPGQDAQGAPWRMGFFHAFYVVSYTATTIGFGELPYAFTEAQRMWMIATVYMTVVAWMYAIGVSGSGQADRVHARGAAHRRAVLHRVRLRRHRKFGRARTHRCRAARGGARLEPGPRQRTAA
jgi:hypothetical protein